MSQYARDLDADDLWLVRGAAFDGCTTKKLAEQMNITEEQVWKFLYSPNGRSLRDRFEMNNKMEEQE